MISNYCLLIPITISTSIYNMLIFYFDFCKYILKQYPVLQQISLKFCSDLCINIPLIQFWHSTGVNVSLALLSELCFYGFLYHPYFNQDLKMPWNFFTPPPPLNFLLGSKICLEVGITHLKSVRRVKYPLPYNLLGGVITPPKKFTPRVKFVGNWIMKKVPT